MTFDELWEAYPTTDHPCLDSTGQPAFDNQCAIRMGAALEAAGVDLSSYDGQTCWHRHGGRHLLRAEEVANWLAYTPGPWSPPETYDGVTSSSLVGRRGIILCRNFWGDGNQGDHIDLWNGTEMRHGSPDYIDRSEQVLLFAL